MDEQNYEPSYYRAPRRSTPANLFSILAVTFAFIALLMLMTGILAVFFGSLSLLFAILAKGRSLRMDATARLAAVVSAFALTAGVALTSYAVYTTLSDETYRARLMKQIDQLYEALDSGDTRRYMELLSEYYYEESATEEIGGGEL